MNIRKILMKVIFAGSVMMSLTACSKEDPAVSAMKERAGSYELTGMTSNGQETAAEDIGLLNDKGLTCIMKLEESGNGVINMPDEEKTLTWDEKTITVDGKAYSYTCEGQTITIENEDSSLVFELAGDQ